MSEDIELDPVDHITVGAIGEPGSRMFLLQASKSSRLHTWSLEKEHVMALGSGSYALLAQIGQQEMTREVLGQGVLGAASAEFTEMMAVRDDEPAFRVDPDSMAMGYDEDKDLIMISFAEIVVTSAEELDDQAMEELISRRSTVKLWVTKRQLAALGIQGMSVVAQGRPLCPLCGAVMEEDHKCPTFVFNGHGPKRQE